MTGRVVAMGAIAGAVSTVAFTALHHVLISDIWATLPLMLVAGVLCGVCLAWTYALLFPAPSVASWYGYNLLHVFMLGVLGAVSVAVFEPITTAAAVIAGIESPNALIRRALPLSAGFAVAWAGVLGVIWARTWAQAGSALVTTAVLTTLLGLNISIIGLVQIPLGSVHLVVLMFALTAALILGFAATFHLLERRGLLAAAAAPDLPGATERTTLGPDTPEPEESLSLSEPPLARTPTPAGPSAGPRDGAPS